MLKLRELELVQLFRQPGGAEFVIFCNKVIRNTCWAYGVPQSEVSSTARTDAKDGGVDTRVARKIDGDKSGYFEAPSVWQFKAVEESNLGAASMAAEVRKPHARKCIKSGDAYRLCICAHLTVEKKESLTRALIRAVGRINLLAPPPKVLGIHDITVVANSYPALIMGYRPRVENLCILFDRLRELVTTVTRNFIPPPSFSQTKKAVLDHTNFDKQVEDAVMALHGLSGVGKTRTVYECFADHAGAGSFVVYSGNEDSLEELANILVNDDSFHAVILADECSLATRVRLSRTLAGCRHRVRCISIDSSSERPGSPAPEFSIRKLSELELQKVLEGNFPEIPSERLRA